MAEPRLFEADKDGSALFQDDDIHTDANPSVTKNGANQVMSLDQAFNFVEEVIKAEELFKTADALDDQGKKQEALVYLDKAISLKPNYAQAHYVKGFCLHSLGRKQEAIDSYNNAIKYDPDHFMAIAGKAGIIGSMGRTQEALELFDTAIDRNLMELRLYANKGTFLSGISRKDEAIACFDEALEINPDHEVINFNKGVCLYDLERYPEALECLNRALKANPNNTEALMSKGLTLEALDREDEAVESYKAYITRDPNNPIVYNSIGHILAEEGKYKEAVEYCEKALKCDPEFILGYCNRGRAHYGLNREELAMADFIKAKELYKVKKGGVMSKGNVIFIENILDGIIGVQEVGQEVKVAMSDYDESDPIVQKFIVRIKVFEDLTRVNITKALAVMNRLEPFEAGKHKVELEKTARYFRKQLEDLRKEAVKKQGGNKGKTKEGENKLVEFQHNGKAACCSMF